MSVDGKKKRIAENLGLAIKKCVEILGDTDDPNSVNFQLIDLAYTDAIYRCFNEGLRLDPENPKRPKAIVSLVHETFFASQLLAVRRLLDKGKDVNSLRRIFDIVNANRELYSREGFLIAKNERITHRFVHSSRNKGKATSVKSSGLGKSQFGQFTKTVPNYLVALLHTQ